jgi:hypothetical protein
MRKTVLVLTCVLLLSTATLLMAQAVGGTLSGKITNAGGQGIPNAAVTVTNTTTNASQRALTGPDGAFTVSNLGPGIYRVDVETQGYKRTSQQNVELTTTSPTSLTIRLEAGSINETVEIRGRAPAVQADGGQMEMGIDTRTLVELPVIDRNYQELIGLQSGVTPPQPALDLVRDPARNRYAAVNGQPPTSNLWTTDGVFNQEPFRHTAVRVQPIESVQALQIETASLRAERGYAGGGVFTSVTRPGVNDWHGTLFAFHSNNRLRTRNFFNTEGQPDPRFVYNQFGATFGGPIARDNTFVFGSYEGTFQNGANTQISTLPTAAMVAGNFSSVPGMVLYQPNTGTAAGLNRTPFPGNTIPANRINPTAAAIASLLPAPNLPGFNNNFISNVPFRNHGNKADGRIDHHFSDRTHALVRYGFTNYWAAESSPLLDVLGAGTRTRNLNHNAVLGLMHSFSPGVTTDLRFGYNRYDQRLNMLSDQTQLRGFFGQNWANNLIGLNISGLAPIGAPSYVPMRGVDNTFNLVSSWGWHTSMHNFKFGLDIRRIRSDGFRDAMWSSMFGPNGTAFFGPGVTMSANGQPLSQFGLLSNSFASFLLGAPTQVGVANFFTEPTIRQTQWAAWLGDTIQIAQRVTLDLGVRYELYSPLEPRNPGGAAFFNTARNTFNFAGIGDSSMRAQAYDWNNVAPRIGISLRPTEKTVIRGGYSIQYFQPPYMLSGFMGPMYGAATGVQGGFAPAAFTGTFGPTVASAVARPETLQNGAAAGNLPATVLLDRFETPYVHSFNAQIQQEFYWGTVLSGAYVGALGRQLPFIQELNAARAGAGTAGLPFLALGRTASTLAFDQGLTTNYNSLQVNLTKRFSRGLSFIGSYTWSRALGYTGNNGMLLNPFDLEANYGPLDYDRQHVLSFSHLWELPFGRRGGNILSTLLGGWQWNGVFTWNTGTPLTITADPISCACPGNTVLANFSGDAYEDIGGTTFLNRAAFSVPSNSLGNSGRGQFRGPGMRNYNTSLFKNFRVRDLFNLQLRGEAYNVTNSPRFAAPVTNLASPNFGQSVSTVNGAFGRQFNLGVRAIF